MCQLSQICIIILFCIICVHKFCRMAARVTHVLYICKVYNFKGLNIFIIWCLMIEKSIRFLDFPVYYVQFHE